MAPNDVRDRDGRMARWKCSKNMGELQVDTLGNPVPADRCCARSHVDLLGPIFQRVWKAPLITLSCVRKSAAEEDAMGCSPAYGGIVGGHNQSRGRRVTFVHRW